ncbi:MAG: filamentous hemagglutinin N-terminal domain-containing protein [Cyanobacteria bacterium P01_F01_bin.150]
MNRSTADSPTKLLISPLFRIAVLIAVVMTTEVTTTTVGARPIPDATLDVGERSQVTPQDTLSDRIEGGAIRNTNLFHSFSEFNVEDGHSAYFANPVGIDRILSRVTGANASNILGTLGVDGPADLFLLNPNGIVFGPNVRLDIAGTFVASTADRILFSDNQTFSAIAPEPSALLTINVPTGLQYGSASRTGNGLWVSNPADITIDPLMVNFINPTLDFGLDVLLATNNNGTGTGNIIQNAPVDKKSGGNAALRMEAANNILLNQDITSNSGQLNIELRADSDNSGAGSIGISGANIDTNGGDFTGFSYGNPGLSFDIRNSTINASGGDITLLGVGQVTTNNRGIGLIDGSQLITTGDGSIALNGRGGTSGDLAIGVDIVEFSTISTENGNIQIIGTGGGVNDGWGVQIRDGSTIRTTDRGDIIIQGTSNGTGFGNYGIRIREQFRNAPGVIETLDSGSITLDGISGNGTNNNTGILIERNGRVTTIDGDLNLTGSGSGTGNDNRGIQIGQKFDIDGTPLAGGAIVSSINGDVNIVGNSESTGSNSIGILIESSSFQDTVEVTSQFGNIFLNGTGGAGNSGSHGIQIVDASSAVRADSGNILINGLANGSSGDNSHGFSIVDGLVQANNSGNIQISGTSETSTVNGFGNEGISILRGRIEAIGTGSIDISGISGTNGVESDGNQGIYIGEQGAAITTANGDITLRGTGRGVGDNHFGIWFGSGDGGLIQAAGAGNVTLEGRVVGANNNSVGLHIIDGGAIATTGTGNITLTANDITLRDDSQGVSGFNRLQLQPLDPDRDITIGGGTIGDRLHLDSSELAQIADTFTQVVIGRENGSGEITVLADTFNHPTVIQAPAAGGNIITRGAIATTNHPLTLNAGSTVEIDNNIRTGNANLTIQGGQISQTPTSTITGGNVALLSTERDITLNNIQAETLTVESAGRVIGNGTLTISRDATFTSNQANTGSVIVTNTQPSTIGYSIIGGNFSLNSSTPIAQAPGEPLQVAGDIAVNGGDSQPLENSEGLPSIRQTSTNGDVVITEVGPIILTSQTITGNLTVNSLPIGVAEFIKVQPDPAIILNQANQFGGTLRFRTNLDGANVVEVTPGITQNGSQIINGLATFNANGGPIVLDDINNLFESIAFSGGDISLAEQDNTQLQRSTAIGNFNLTSGGLVEQAGPLRISGNTNVTTDLPQSGTVRLRNQGATVLDTSLIGGDLIIDSSGTISQRPGSLLQVAGETTILNPAENPGLDTSGNIIPRLNLPNGDVVITTVGPITLASENFAGNLTVISLAESLEFLDGVLYTALAIDLNANNTFDGTVSFTTDAPTVVAESSVPSITQTGAIQVPGRASFTAENGTITLNRPNNTFDSLTFNSGQVSIREGNATDLLASTATDQLSLTANGAIRQNGSLVANGPSQFNSLAPDAPITLRHPNQFSGSISLSTVGQSDVAVTNTLQNTQLGDLNVGGDLTINSGGGLSQSSPIQIIGMTTLNAGSQDILLSQANDLSQLMIEGGNQVKINDISSISLLESQVQGQLRIDAIGDITTQGIESLGGIIKLNSTDGSIDTTAGLLRSSLRTGDGGMVNLIAAQDLRLGPIEASGERGGQIILIAGDLLQVEGDDISATTTGDGNGRGVLLRADTIHLLDGGRVLSQTSGSGQAGNMIVEARQLLIHNSLVPGPELTPNDFEGDEFTADNLILDRFTEREFTGLGTNTNPGSTGDGGDIHITVTERLKIVGNDSTPFNADPADPASVLEVATVPTGILSSSAGEGQSGNIMMEVGELIMRDRVGMGAGPLLRDFSADNDDSIPITNGGSITIVADSVLFRNRAGIVTSPLGPGNAGDLTMTVAQTLTLARGGSIIADSPATTDGNAGDVTITADQINLRRGGRIGSSTASAGQGGDIFIRANGINIRGEAIASDNTDDIDRPLTPSGIFSSALEDSSDPAGNITLTVNTLNITNGGEINASTAGTGSAGDISIQEARDITLDEGTISSAVEATANLDPKLSQQGGDILIESDRLSLSENAKITSSTSGIGDAGTIRIREATRINLETSSEISTAVENGARGDGGQIILNDIGRLNIDDAQISASTAGRGPAGGIRIRGDRLFLNNNAQITSSTAGIGDAGTINITDATRIRLDTGSEISTAVESNAEGTAGDIRIRGNRLFLSENASITSSTAGIGDAGTIRIQDATRIDLDSDSEISTEVLQGATGDGGTIELRNIGNLDIQNRATISARSQDDNDAGDININATTVSLTDRASITAETVAGQGGDIDLQDLASLEVRDNSRIEATTQIGRAGTIDIVAQDSISVSNGSTLSVAAKIDNDTTSSSTSRILHRANGDNDFGIAGDLSIETNSLDVSDDSRISVESRQGQAGNINITASTIVLNDGDIEATTGRNPNDGTRSANVSLTLTGLDDSLRLQNGSLISADASLDADAESDANAGNITINAANGFIIADVFENSDIIATAGEGDGGNINLTAFDVFGIEERSGSRDELLDNTTNDISASSEFGTSGNVAVNDLGIDPVQAAADLPVDTAPPDLSQGCQPGIDGQGRFINTERGGIPSSPDDPIASDDAWEDIHPPGTSTEPTSIIEAETWHIKEDGQIVLHSESNPDAFHLTCQF